MKRTTNGKRHIETYDSLAEFIDYSKTLPAVRQQSLRYGSDGFYGKGKYAATTFKQLYDVAAKGMAREGIDAIAIASERVTTITREMTEEQFSTYWDVCGADVDVPAYLAGEHECMMDYRTSDVLNQTPIVTLVINIACPGGVSAQAFTKQGQALMAVAEAIDAIGLQCEIFAESSLDGYDGECHGRTSIRLKSAADAFDPGAFMFVLTHPAMFRALMLNAMHGWPEHIRSNYGVTSATREGSGYGRCTQEFRFPDDYPEGTVYIPPCFSSSEAGNFVERVLKELNLA